MNRRFVTVVIGIAFLVWNVSGCTKGTEPKDVAASNATVKSLSDQPLSAYQVRLLDLAFTTATMIPIRPHLKDRSRVQQDVVWACLKLDQPQRSLGYLTQIQDWRQGLAYADLADYAVQHGSPDESESYLDSALQIAETEGLEKARADQIKVRIAQTLARLGQTEQAKNLDAGLETFVADKVGTVIDANDNPESFETLIAELDRRIADGTLESFQNTANVYVRLLDRYYPDKQRRSQIRDKIPTCLAGIPMMARIKVLMEIAEVSLDHQDSDMALEWIRQGREWLDSAQWRPEHRTALMARLAALRYRAGEPAVAQAELDAARSFYDDNRSRIVNIYRAEAVRQLAVASQKTGDSYGTLMLFKRAVEEGMDNPNSRPRAEDLSATCLSMALDAVEPDAELWTRLQQIHQGLGSPW